VGTVKQTSAWAIGARVGVLVTPSFLAFVTGGYTRARFSDANMVVNEISDPFLGAVASQIGGRTHSGWFIGSGIETALDGLGPIGQGWFWRNEYRYAQYDSATTADICINDVVCLGSNFIGVPAGTTLSQATIRPIVQTVRSELVYKFSPGPRTARALASASPVVPAGSWTGFYAGAGFGYGMFNLDTQWTGDFDPFAMPLTQTQGGRGWLATVTVGADYQINNRIVVGLLADHDWADMKGTLQYQVDFSAGTTTQRRAWAVGARVGLLATPALLTYINGGYTEASFSAASLVGTDALAPNLDVGVLEIPAKTYSGWFIGSGVEARLDALGVLGRGWFWRNEYRYARYDRADLPVICANPAVCPGPPNFVPVGTVVSVASIQPSVQTFRTQLVYKFGWGGPALAKP
jgi:outer membrane immunogenic protein